MTPNPHGTQVIISIGTPLADAAGVLILAASQSVAMLASRIQSQAKS
jgi:hypothetical protein